MRSLREKGLVETLQTYSGPMLGICLGMQMMFEDLGEGGVEGLALFDGDIETLEAGALPLPHMGWNGLDVRSDDALLDGVSSGDYVYFVHSFGAKPSDKAVASATYGQPFAAVVRDGNRMGCQFHPERSGPVGSKILENFLSL
jgi:glutamine amidotransferase